MATQRKYKTALAEAEKKLEKAKNDLTRKQGEIQKLIKLIPKYQNAVESLRDLCGLLRGPRLDKSPETTEVAPGLPQGMSKADTCEHGVVKGEDCPQCRRAAQPLRAGDQAKGVIRGDPSFHEDGKWN